MAFRYNTSYLTLGVQPMIEQIQAETANVKDVVNICKSYEADLAAIEDISRIFDDPKISSDIGYMLKWDPTSVIEALRFLYHHMRCLETTQKVVGVKNAHSIFIKKILKARGASEA